VRSENPVGADNQQESLSSEERRFWFLAGLVEGEGSVTLSIKAHPTKRFGYYVQPEFFIYQHRVRRQLLEMAQEFFGTGRIKPKPGNPEVLVYSVMSRGVLAARIVPFLERCREFSARGDDYAKFIAIVSLLEAGFHRTPEGLAAIIELGYSMNMAGKQRRIPLGDILDRILRGHTPDVPRAGTKRWSDLRGDT
jgi:LAGLIDADG endonuclease